MPQVFQEVGMSLNTWISAREALRRAKDQDVTAGDLIEWARQGKLRARAARGLFSDDDPGEERVFPSEPPLDEKKRLVSGDWPDIPADFWDEIPSRALWAAGTFGTRVSIFNEHYQQYEWLGITLFDVKFHADELDALLIESPQIPVKPQPPRERWQAQRPTEPQRAVMQFLGDVRNFPPKEPLGPVALHNAYRNWANQKNKEIFGRSTFAKWVARYDDGWRLSGNRWEHCP